MFASAVIPALIAGPLPVAAQSSAPSPAQEPQKLERVEITGSSLKRIDAESALPVQVWRREDIERSGATTTSELLQKLPMVQRSTTESVSVGAGGSGFAGVSLHGLGEVRTLVLLNGRRIAGFGGQALTGKQAGIELNSIPLAAVERVEILSDGASALYGSDAIGGVVNIILKRNFTAGEANVGGSWVPGRGGDTRNLSAVKGWGDIEADGYNFMLSASHDTRKPVAALDRPFTNAIINFVSNNTPYGYSRGSVLAIPANVIGPFGPASPFLAANGFCPPNHVAVGLTCLFNNVSMIEIMPQTEHDNIGLSFNRKLNADLRFFADVMAGRSTTTSRVAPTPGQVLIPTTSPLFPFAASVGAVTDTVALWRVADLGQRVTVDRTDSAHLVTGVEGNWSGWDFTASLTHSENKYAQILGDGWVSAGAVAAAFGSGLLNPFVGPGQQSAAGLAALNAAKVPGYFDGGKTTFDFAEVRGSREVAQLPSGPAMLGAGVTWSRDNYKTLPSALAQGVGDTRFGDATTVTPYTAKRTAWGTFAELLTPLSKELELTSGLRRDEYSDFGSTTNYKLAARWQPSRSFLLRGSTGTGFRAPTIPQISAGRQNFGVTTGSYACPFTPAQLPAGVECPAGVTQYTVFGEGNPSLKPETSRQFSLGARWEPSEILTIGLDWWQIRLDNTIGQIDEATAFGDPLTYSSLFTNYVDPVSGKRLLAFNQGSVNLGKASYQGIDIDARLRVRTAFGTWGSHLLATYMLDHSYQRVKGGAFFSDLGNYNDGNVTFRLQGRLINTLQYGPLTHALTLNFKSGYTENVTATNLVTSTPENVRRRVRAYTTWDWQSVWKLQRQFDLALGVVNLFDQDPPMTLKNSGQQIGYDERHTDPRGRTVYANLKYRF